MPTQFLTKSMSSWSEIEHQFRFCFTCPMQNTSNSTARTYFSPYTLLYHWYSPSFKTLYFSAHLTTHWPFDHPTTLLQDFPCRPRFNLPKLPKNLVQGTYHLAYKQGITSPYSYTRVKSSFPCSPLTASSEVFNTFVRRGACVLQVKNCMHRHKSAGYERE